MFFTGEIIKGDVAIKCGKIVGVHDSYAGAKEIDLSGKHIVPGLIDGHIHIESSMLTPSEFAIEYALQRLRKREKEELHMQNGESCGR